jgi:hypothetical protein
MNLGFSSREFFLGQKPKIVTVHTLGREKYTLPVKLLFRPLGARKPLAHALSTIIFPFGIILPAQ